MIKLNRLFNSIQLRRILVVFVAGTLLFLSTACTNPPEGPKASGEGSYYESRGQETERYDPIQSKGNGFNQYPDTDPRDPIQREGNKARALVENAKANTRDPNTNPRDLVEEIREGRPVQDRTAGIGDRIQNAAENLREDFAEGTDRGIRNTKANLDRAGDESRRIVDEAGDRAQDTAKDVTGTAQKAANKVDRS